MLKDLCFEIINKCPNKCMFCSSRSCIDGNIIIKYEDFKRVIDYFMNNGGIEEISLSGGEPFLHPDIFKMIEYCKNYGIRTIIFTSGIKRSNALSEDVIRKYINMRENAIEEVKIHEPDNYFLIDKIRKYYNNFIIQSSFSSISKDELKLLKELGLDKIVFDMQAYEYETDEYLMGRESIKHTYLLDSLLNASIVGLDTDVHFIPMKPNYKEIGDILELLEIAKIKNISVLKFVPQGRGKENIDDLELDNNEINEFMDLLNKHKEYFSGNVRIGIPLLGNNTHMCTAGLSKLDIKYDGTILPCPAFKELDIETMQKYGIKFYNIYDNLEDVVVPGGHRVEPLCQKVYYKKK